MTRFLLVKVCVNFSHSMPVESQNEETLWMHSQGQEPRAVALIVHGLNARPSSMNGIANEFVQNGVSVLRVGLKGHFGDLESMREVAAQDWVGQVDDALAQIEKFRQGLGRSVPLVAVGHSLGALLLVSRQNRAAIFDRMLLIAPAIKLRWYAHLARLYRFLNSRQTIATRNIREYWAQDQISFAAYNGLFNVLDSFLASEADQSRLNIPTQVFCDLEDELVQPESLRAWAQGQGFSKWTFEWVKNSDHRLKKSFHHLILDETTLGSEFEKLKAAILRSI